jgi:myosin heavy subunit
MSQGEPHFIRCIKPNSHQRPHHFDEKIVMSQLISTGKSERAKTPSNFLTAVQTDRRGRRHN